MREPESLSGEFDYIAWIRRATQSDRRVPIGIGDDTAVLKLTPGRDLLVTTDMIIEDVHFDLRHATFEQVGRKAMAVNLSDIAAMAGIPVAAVAAVGLSDRTTRDQAEALFHGIQEIAHEFDVAIIGGDTNRSPRGLVISITLLGETTERGPVRRSGAKPGDWILVTGSLGGSIRGKHLNFTPRVRESLRIHERYPLHAMIDISDGLAADLGHILRESNCGATLRAGRIPISDTARENPAKRDPLQHALYDGEDFELLITLAESDARRLLQDPSVGVPITHIGETTEGRGLSMQTDSGDCQPIEPCGYDHFKQ